MKLYFFPVAMVLPDPKLEHLARWSDAYRERPAAQEVLLL